MSIEDLLAKLDGVREIKPGQWMARCPAHDDTNPSLSITDGGDKILLKCFAGCSLERICTKLGIEPRDLFLTSKDRREIVATYDYRDEEGNLLFQVVRYQPKTFRQRRPDGKGGWIYDLKGVRRVLYRLPEVIEAERVFLVEGEKDADNLARRGLVATTAPGGAKKWLPQYTEALAGKEVVILPDNDPPGREHAELVARSLYGRAKIKVVELPDLPEHGDVSDWLAAGHTLEELLELVERAPEWAPPPEPKPELAGGQGTYIYRHPKYGITVKARSVRLHSDGRLTAVLRIVADATGVRVPGGTGVINLAAPGTRRQLARALEEEYPMGAWPELLADLYERIEAREREGEPWQTLQVEAPPPPQGWLCRPLLPEGDITILYGPGAAAKSLTGMLCAILVGAGRGKAGPLEPQAQGEVLYLDWEDHPDEARRRLWRLTQGIGLPAPPVRYRKCVTPLPDDLEAVQEAVLEFRAKLVIVDSLLPAAGAAEGRDPASVAQRLFEALRRLDTTCLVIAHHGKDKERGIYGSIFFRWLARNVVRAEPYTEAGEDSLLVAFFHEKSNRGRLEGPWGLEFTFDGETGPIRVRYADPRENPAAAPNLPETQRVRDALTENGRMSPKEIAEATGIPSNTVRALLKKLERRGEVRRRGRGIWEAVAEEEPPYPETQFQTGEDGDEEVPF